MGPRECDLGYGTRGTRERFCGEWDPGNPGKGPGELGNETRGTREQDRGNQGTRPGEPGNGMRGTREQDLSNGTCGTGEWDPMEAGNTKKNNMISSIDGRIK